MNYDVYIEGNKPVRLLSDIINEIYFTEEYTVTSEWDGEIPEDVLMMNKLGIERVSGREHHKSVYQKSLEKLEEYRDKIQQYELYNSLFDSRNSRACGYSFNGGSCG